MQDNGAGFIAEQRASLFQPFRQFHGREDGAGLGPYISKGIVEMHGGRVWGQRGGPSKPGTAQPPPVGSVNGPEGSHPRKAQSPAPRGHAVPPRDPSAQPPGPPAAAPGGPDLAFVERIAPVFRAVRDYARLRVSGIENVPREGPALLAANHTGWLGLDFALAALSLHDGIGRLPRGMVHKAWFATAAGARFAARVGLIEVSKEAMAQQVAAGQIVLVFPEGEKGAFRPPSGYRVEEFARGFVRVAMAHRCPVVPVCIVGGEEANPVGRRITAYEDLLKVGLPIPRNVLPRPVKWRIRFLPPVDFSEAKPGDPDDKALVHAVAADVRSRVQAGLDQLKLDRGHPFL